MNVGDDIFTTSASGYKAKAATAPSMFGLGSGGLASGSLAAAIGAKSPFVNGGVSGPRLGESTKKHNALGIFG